MKTRIFSILCENAPGVMMRISRDFTRRQINIDSITVGIEPTGFARIILLFKADDRMAELMHKVLTRLTQVMDVEVIDPTRSVVREIALLKTRKLSEEEMWRVVQRVEGTGGAVLESKGNVLIIELSGEHEKVEEIIKSLGVDVLVEVARSGQVLVSRASEG